jgi:hypothetical protein
MGTYGLTFPKCVCVIEQYVNPLQDVLESQSSVWYAFTWKWKSFRIWYFVYAFWWDTFHFCIPIYNLFLFSYTSRPMLKLHCISLGGHTLCRTNTVSKKYWFDSVVARSTDLTLWCCWEEEFKRQIQTLWKNWNKRLARVVPIFYDFLHRAVYSVEVTLRECIEMYLLCRCCVCNMKWHNKIKYLLWKALHFHCSFGICKNIIKLGILLCYTCLLFIGCLKYTYIHSGMCETKVESVFILYSINCVLYIYI